MKERIQYSDEEQHKRDVLWVQLEQFVRFQESHPHYQSILKRIQEIRNQWQATTDTLELEKLVNKLLGETLDRKTESPEKVHVPAK